MNLFSSFSFNLDFFSLLPSYFRSILHLLYVSLTIVHPRYILFLHYFLSYSYSSQHWVVFEKVSELIILVPALLGLKGNLEMTLASRLSTQANLGHMDTPKQQWYMIVGNLVLIQVSRIQILFLLFPFIFKSVNM